MDDFILRHCLYHIGQIRFSCHYQMVEERKAYIDHSLEVAQKANAQLAKIKEDSEALIEAANKEQGRILREAMVERDKIIVEARKQAQMAAQKELDEVRRQISQEKEEAIRDIRRQVAVLSVDIAEKVIRKNLDEEHEQMEMIDRMLDEMLQKKINIFQYCEYNFSKFTCM